MDPLEHLNAQLDTCLSSMGLNPEVSATPSGHHVLRHGDALVLVSGFLRHKQPFCRIAAIVRSNVSPSLELLHRLLRLNHGALLGAFQLFEDGTVIFGTTLPAEALDPDVFARALRYVARSADAACEQLQPLAGGTPGAASLDLELR